MSLLKLPTELLSEICGYLEHFQTDLCAVRLTCKALFLASPRNFIDGYCKSIRLLSSSESLRQLEFIAADDYRRTQVHELFIVTTDLDAYGEIAFCDFEYSPFGRIISFRRPQASLTEHDLYDRHNAYQAIIAERDSIIKTDTLEKALVKCMKCFENLTTIGLRTMPMRDLFKSDFMKDSQCLGIRRFKEILPCDRITRFMFAPELMDASLLESNRGLVFSHLINALSQCDRLRIQTLYSYKLTPEHLAITKSQYKGLMPQLRGLEHLQLHLHNVRSESKEARSRFEALLGLLITIAPNLRVLEFSQAAQEQNTKLLLMNSQVFSQQASCISFLRLEELHLCHFDITTSALIAFIRAAIRTLKALTLSIVSLNDEIPSTPQDENAISKDIIWPAESKESIRGLWQQVLDFFHQLDLQYLKLETLMYRHNEVQMNDISARYRPIPAMICFGPAPNMQSPGINDVQLPRMAPSRAPGGACYDALRSCMPFHEWLNQVEIVPESNRQTEERSRKNRKQQASSRRFFQQLPFYDAN